MTGTEARGARLGRTGPALVVALGAAATTAHGGFEVAVAAGVPVGIAWVYPVIGDGLALVAYSATIRLAPAGRVYAWVVVVLAAGVSGLAQAVFLASGSLAEAPAGLRFGVGAWPAVAAAIAAHLLHLLRTPDTDAGPGEAPNASSVTSPHAEPDPTSAQVASTPTAPGEPDSCVVAAVGPAPAPAGLPAPRQDEADPRVREVAELLAAGADVTGPQAAALHGVSDRTGRRLLAEARAHLERHPIHDRPGLHLVETPTAGGT